MRYLTFSTPANPSPRLGALIGDRILDLQAAQVDGRRAAPDTLLELIQHGADAWAFANEVANAGGPAEAARHVRALTMCAGTRRFRAR